MRKWVFMLLLATVIGIGALHFFTSGHLAFYHDTYRRLSYFPIVVGSILFGIWGGLSLAILTSLAFIPHILLYIDLGTQAYISELTEIFLYLAAAVVIGIIAGRETRLREKYRQLSEKLKKSYERLHDEAELLLELESQLQASQKLSALGELSASLAHEIKNPLSSIKGATEILLDDYAADHPKREFVEILNKEVKRLDSSVDRVLGFSRGSKKKQRVEHGMPVSSVIQDMLRLTQKGLSDKNIDIQVEQLELGSAFLVDGDRISQVFLNLLLNARDAIEQSGNIRIALQEKDNGIAVLIADSGKGIPEGAEEDIFKPFYSQKENGNGLGLSISRKIVESYGGRLTVSKSESGGAVFCVWLPQEGEQSFSGI